MNYKISNFSVGSDCRSTDWVDLIVRIVEVICERLLARFIKSNR